MRVIQGMYEDNKIVVMYVVGVTDVLNVQVQLHQGSALSPFLFAVVMDRLTEEIR